MTRASTGSAGTSLPRRSETHGRHTSCTQARTGLGLLSTQGEFATLVGVTMSIHKLTAGSGYDYLTRQVAAQDATDKGHTGLAAYYTEQGETPGVWVGSGLAGIDGLTVGRRGHRRADAGPVRLRAPPPGAAAAGAAAGPGPDRARLPGGDPAGAPYKVYAGDVSAFRIEVAHRIADAGRRGRGLPGRLAGSAGRSGRGSAPRWPIEFFRAEHGRPPGRRPGDRRHDRETLPAADDRGRRLRPDLLPGQERQHPVGGRRPATVAAQIERGPPWRPSRTRCGSWRSTPCSPAEGPNGVRQVDVRGLVATAFTHRDSRAGDPDLHTHVAVANKVQTLDGRWLGIDGRVLFKANVAASETYNTALENAPARRPRGARSRERPDADARQASGPGDGRCRPRA